MGTGFYLTGVKFNNPDLPQVAPYSVDGILRDGLIAAWRPYSGAASLQDLSGNNNILTAVGTPAYDSQSVILDYAAGAGPFFNTAIQEIADITIMTVARPIQNTDGSWGTGTAYTSRGIGGQDASTGSGRGIGPIFRTGTNATTSQIELKVGCNFAVYNNTTSAYTSGIREIAIASAATLAGIPQSAVNWQFVAQSYQGNRCDMIAPVIGWHEIINYTGSALSFQKRKLTSPSDGTPNILSIGGPYVGSTFGANRGRVQIAEVLVFNRGLSADEINQQYTLSKNWLYANRGITI